MLNYNDINSDEKIAESIGEKLSKDFDLQNLDEHSYKQILKSIAKYKILGGLIPADYNGYEIELTKYIQVLNAFAKGVDDFGLLFGISANVFACEIILMKFAPQDVKLKWLSKLAKGEAIGAIAATEPGGGSSVFQMDTVITKEGDDYIVNGKKRFITNCPICDFILLFGNLKKKNADGITCIIIEKGTNGLNMKRMKRTMGLRSAFIGEIEFDNCIVSANSLVGRESSGKIIFMHAMEWERGCLMAPVLGIMEKRLSEISQFAKERKNGSLSKYQSVTNRIAQMRIRIEIAKLILDNFLKKKSLNKRAHLESILAKIYITEMIINNSIDALKIRGAEGYLCDNGIETTLRDSFGYLFSSGTIEIQYNMISKMCGL